jgi:hypothetical protein
MTGFQVGDRVVITAPPGGPSGALGLFVGKTGAIVTADQTPKGLPYPYAVQLDGGPEMRFAADELASTQPTHPRANGDPTHYTSHPSGVECIDITKWMNFPLGNAIKYIWRAGLKETDPIPDLLKARDYIDIEINRLQEQRIA